VGPLAIPICSKLWTLRTVDLMYFYTLVVLVPDVLFYVLVFMYL
jgi:hypothetical protein